MEKQVLSIEQMKHLQGLGLDTSGASMVLIAVDDDGCSLDWQDAEKAIKHHWHSVYFSLYDAQTGSYDHSYKKSCGVFTLQDILDKLPSSINWNPLIIVGNTIMYSAGYGEGYDNPLVVFDEKSLLDSAYNILCWVIENGYIETKKKDNESSTK